MRRGVIFSLDAVFALLFLLAFAAVITAYSAAVPYSNLANYDSYRFADTSLVTLKSNGAINSAVSQLLAGDSKNAAKTLRFAMKNMMGQKSTKAITLEIYDSNGVLTSTLYSSDPPNKYPKPEDVVTAVRTTFFYGDNKYGLAFLQVW